MKFGLFWSGSKLSFLRYMTFYTLRYFHPDAEIELYIPKTCKKHAKWGIEKQDFQNYSGPCCLKQLDQLNIKIINIDLFPTYAPNYQSDFFRWWWLYNNGGFYLDTDQLILRNFSDLPLDVDLIYSMYKANSCGIYSPVGVIGSSKKSPIIKTIMDEIATHYDESNYNSAGPFMFSKLMTSNQEDWEKSHKLYNTPSFYFYPMQESYLVYKLYNDFVYINQESFALHWFGGHPMSQEFNNKFDYDFLLKSNDTISSILRKMM